MVRDEVLRHAEIVVFDPDNPDTYPSVCGTAEDVKARFGFTGGEKLLFDEHGKYRGQLTMMIGDGN